MRGRETSIGLGEVRVLAKSRAQAFISFGRIAPLQQSFLNFSRLQKRGGLPARCVVFEIDPQKLAKCFVEPVLVKERFTPHELGLGGKIAPFASVDHRLESGSSLFRPCESQERPAASEFQLGQPGSSAETADLDASAFESASAHRFRASRLWTCLLATRTRNPCGIGGAWRFGQQGIEHAFGSRGVVLEKGGFRPQEPRLAVPGAVRILSEQAIERGRSRGPVSELDLSSAQAIEDQRHERPLAGQARLSRRAWPALAGPIPCLLARSAGTETSGDSSRMTAAKSRD